ncbi:MAG: DUF4347 domain-containing protein [Cyanobacteria bacterium P01_E01_bin.45]
MNKPQENHVMTPEVLIRGQANTSGVVAIAEEDHQFGQAPGVNLLFVDSSVDNIDTLISQVKQDTQVIVLDGQTDGISQITDALSDYQNVSSLSVVSHGDSGQLQLGSSSLSSASLSSYRDELHSWQSVLTADADILFYGCNVADGQQGAEFLNQLGQLTGADIAASDDLTGSSKLGGDWQLEFATGQIETDSPFHSSIEQRYQSVLEGKTIFSDGNESGLGDYRIHSKTKHGVNTVSNPSGSGKVLRFDLRKGDPLVSNSSRAEVIPKIDETTPKFGQNYTYSLRTYIPNDWQSDSSMEIITQWHAKPDTHLGETWRNPPAALRIQGNSFNLKQAWDADAVTNTKDKTSHGSRTTNLGSLNRGEWTDWSFEIKWSYKSDGIFRVYKDGELVFDKKGPNTFNDKLAPFSKMGIYKPDWKARPEKSSTTRRVLYIDDFTMETGHSSQVVGIQSVPDAKDDRFTTNEDTAVTGNVLTGAGADDAGAGTLAVTSNSKPANGSLTIQEDGHFTYKPNANFYGTDSFTYTVQNSQGLTDKATVTLTVEDINDRPSTNGTIPTQQVTDGSTVSLDVSSYFSDLDGTIASYIVTGLPKGLSINNQGIISGTIDPNASDAANNNSGSQEYRVTITAMDDDGAVANQVFNYTVANVGPTANDDAFTTNEDTPFTGNVLKGPGADRDGGTDSDPLSVIAHTDPANGSLTIQQDGTFTYTPNTNFFGQDSFTYTIDDGNGGIDRATVTLTVKEEILPRPESASASIEEEDITPGPEPTPTSFRVEAESLELDTFRVESRSFASGRKMISLRGKGSNQVGKATYVHKGGSGTFDIDLRYFDENDGASTIKVKLNGQELDRWVLDAQTTQSNARASNSRIRTIQGISLSDGDRLSIIGLENKSEHVRIDYLDFKSVAPTPTPIRVEAEDLQVDTYRPESFSYASGGKVLSLRGGEANEVGRAIYTHQGTAGTYNLDLTYFDENDGVSTIKVLLNGKQVDLWSLDEDPNGPPVSASTQRVRTIQELTLKEGDRLAIVGSENAAEHVRIDYLELTPALLQPLAA